MASVEYTASPKFCWNSNRFSLSMRISSSMFLSGLQFKVTGWIRKACWSAIDAHCSLGDC